MLTLAKMAALKLNFCYVLLHLCVQCSAYLTAKLQEEKHGKGKHGWYGAM